MYLIASAEEVFSTKRTPFLETLQAVEAATERRAKEIFEDLKFGELFPKEGEYAKVTLRPEMFLGIDDTALSGTFRQNIDSTGWKTILHGDLTDRGPVGEKWVMGIAGIAILDSAVRLSQIQIRKGDRSYAIMDIEDINRGPVAILFKVKGDEIEDLVFDYSADFYLDAYAATTGYQTVKPIGIAFLPQKQAIAQSY